MDGTRQATLRERVRAKLMDRTLTTEDPVRTWAGPGAGIRCAVCDEPIERTDTEYELEFSDGAGTLRFHRECQAAWEVERRTA